MSHSDRDVIGPFMGKVGESRFGFTVLDRIVVVNHRHFNGWRGYVVNFDKDLVAVYLDKPINGFSVEREWFSPDSIVLAPE